MRTELGLKCPTTPHRCANGSNRTYTTSLKALSPKVFLLLWKTMGRSRHHPPWHHPAAPVHQLHLPHQPQQEPLHSWPPQRLYSGWVCLSLCQVKTKPVVTHALHFFRHAKPEHTWKPQMCNTATNSVPFFIHKHVRNLLVNTQRKFICDEHDLNTSIWQQCKSADYCKWTESS